VIGIRVAITRGGKNQTGERLMLEAKRVAVDEGFDEGTVAGQVTCNSLLEEIQLTTDIKLSGLHRRGVVLFSEGQQARGVFVLRAGRAKVSISSSKGKVIILRIAQAGDLLGLNSVLNDLPYDATVETLERCRTEYLGRYDLMALLDRSSRARTGLSEVLSKELTEVVEHARSLLLPQLTGERLAKLLLRWCDGRDAGQSEGIRLNHGLTQEEIGQMICTSRETVARLLAEFKRQRILSFADHEIFISNLQALELMACS
jgi:CRP/FNR family transcriptional regulator, cyclic AMP receptor protein